MTYSYECPKCFDARDIQKPVADYDREEKCSKCSEPMKRLITATTFHLKGGGWSASGYQKPKVEFKMKNGTSQVVDYDPRKLKNKGE